MSSKDQVRTYILENYLFTNDPDALGDDDSFMELGIIDSTGVLELIAFLEETFAIRVDEGDMLPENLDSINRLAAYLQRQMALSA
jgi:acyl carrier protein